MEEENKNNRNTLLDMGFDSEKVDKVIAEHPDCGIEALVNYLDSSNSHADNKPIETKLTSEEARLKALELQEQIRKKMKMAEQER